MKNKSRDGVCTASLFRACPHVVEYPGFEHKDGILSGERADGKCQDSRDNIMNPWTTVMMHVA